VRVFTAVVIWVLLVELVLGLAFWAGTAWLGGWQMGMLMAGAVLLLMLLPWLGELSGSYDSKGNAAQLRIGWWGTFSFTQEPEQLIEVRVIGIPWRRKLKSKEEAEEEAKAAEATEGEEKKPAAKKDKKKWRLGPENIADATRAVFAALAGSTDLMWDAREIHCRVDAPTGQATADDVIARVWDHRGVGPVDLKATPGDGTRRVRARYRIGLFRAMIIMMIAVFQSRMMAVARSGRSSEDADDTPEQKSDEELVRELAKQMKEADEE